MNTRVWDKLFVEEAHVWLVAQLKTFFFFFEGVQKLVQCWTMCIHKLTGCGKMVVRVVCCRFVNFSKSTVDTFSLTNICTGSGGVCCQILYYNDP